MKIQKRIKQIVSLTIDDFYSSGRSTNETTQSLKEWLFEDILKIEGVEDLYTYQISILILDKLKALDIVDLNFIYEALFRSNERNIEPVDLKLDEVVL